MGYKSQSRGLSSTIYDIVEKVFHRCGICQLPILLDSDAIASHLGNNKVTQKMSHKQYNENFMNKPTNPIKPKSTITCTIASFFGSKQIKIPIAKMKPDINKVNKDGFQNHGHMDNTNKMVHL